MSILSLVGNEAPFETAKKINELVSHSNDIRNPHNVTKAQVGLGNADNTTDLNKPISIATQSALDLKVDKIDLREVGCIINDFQSGADYVLIWSNGWCVQGGEFPSSWNWQSIEVPLIQPYRDEHYHVSITPGWNSAVGSNYNSIKTPNKFSCLILSNYYDGYGTGTWEASGFIR